jgi:hypothetical protein
MARVIFKDLNHEITVKPGTPLIEVLREAASGSVSNFLTKIKRFGLKIIESNVHHYPRLSGQQTGAS